MNAPQDENPVAVDIAVDIADAIAPLFSEHDPRAVARALLGVAADLTNQIIEAGRWSHSDAAVEFGACLASALRTRVQPERPRIQVVDASALKTQ